MAATRPAPRNPNPPIPSRTLGKTGREVTIFGLGGEGVLRTQGRMQEAVQVIQRALDQGVTYCDTAPAYAGSMDYYGAALGDRRSQVFLACKTHDRTRDGSLRLLDDSLRRLRTNYLDLWQLHDLRDRTDLERIFQSGGALEALLRAREDGCVKHLGLTGHHDPAILVEAMRRFAFDTVLVALNAADVHRLSFIKTVLVEAKRQNMGVIAMKSLAAGRILEKLSVAEALGYAWSLPAVSLAVVGCSTPAEVEKNAETARYHKPFSDTTMRDLESRTRAQASTYSYFKMA